MIDDYNSIELDYKYIISINKIYEATRFISAI